MKVWGGVSSTSSTKRSPVPSIANGFGPPLNVVSHIGELVPYTLCTRTFFCQAESAKDGQAWYAKEQSGRAHNFKEFVSRFALWGELSVVTWRALCLVNNKKNVTVIIVIHISVPKVDTGPC